MVYKDITLAELAELLDGELIGNSRTIVNKVSVPENYEERSIVFIKNPNKWIKKNQNTDIRPGCIILEENALKNYKGANQIIVKNYDKALITVLEFYAEKEERKQQVGKYIVLHSHNISNTAHIEDFVTVGEHSKIGDETRIGHGTYIGNNVVIGNNVRIFPNCTIYDNVTIENNVTIHGGVVIGADGFGYVDDENGNKTKIPQIGDILIKDNAEIGANTTIDRSTIGTTIIGRNTKIDNLCQIAHNVVIGENCVIAGMTAVGGSAVLGNNCVIAGQVAIEDHVKLESGTVVGGKSGVLKSSSRQSKYLLGTPAKDMMKEKKVWAFLNKSTEILERLRRLERHIK